MTQPQDEKIVQQDSVANLDELDHSVGAVDSARRAAVSAPSASPRPTFRRTVDLDVPHSRDGRIASQRA